MNNQPIFSFENESVAKSYDDHLVPVLFDPWARQLINDHAPWKHQHVLDLACGTGVVTGLLAAEVGDQGKVIAADFNSQMMALARLRCSKMTEDLSFVECSADAMPFEKGTFDVVVCQQGFQFFPDQSKAAEEIKRVLKADGKAVIATWRPITECDFFGGICEVLEQIGEHGISQMMRVPFDNLSQEQLKEAFMNAGFSKVDVSIQERNLIIPKSTALELIYATPIGPKILAMSKECQHEFHELAATHFVKLSPDGKDMGRMSSNMLVAYKEG